MTNTKFGEINPGYLNRITDIINFATTAHARISVFTFVLRLPEHRDTDDSIACVPDLSSGLMERFTGALRARIAAHQKRRKKEELQVCPTDMRHVWVREVGISGKSHYHMAIFVNKDTFNGLGNYSKEDHNLGSYICEAWLSALGLLEFPEYRTLVALNNKPHYLERLRVDRYGQQILSLRSHLSYFAKERTKSYNKEERSFGGSVR
ncbi:inovirus Gp2 family protein [Cronobacter sakazakii]|uniref:inovirus Gp2 family protein n=1 Tax=Enterobacteriaceae TaxID=543 RepID=UPI000CFD1F54|nr:MULTISPECIES: inovirus Gp2 family protein [Enterobacteriaceae]EGE7877455.1 inovirus Gp2 family protein [Escherichia coli]EKA9349910.1 inovirus Gp2 family protein [Cronobacter sakazakii]EKY3116651.1 inovirus Gp2 family protein [Cronobacter sakazakii]ELY4091708.1 inovirus Gp2 family protein [Cronobacter sakazakii]